MTPAIVLPVVPFGEVCHDVSHYFSQRDYLAGVQQQVHMVRHDGIGVESVIVAFLKIAQEMEKLLNIGCLIEQGLFVVAPHDNMVWMLGDMNAR